MERDFDFIANDYSAQMPTPEFIKEQTKFFETMSDLSEHEYDQFVRMRRAIIDRLHAAPSTPFDDETGQGITFSIIESHTPTSKVWDLLGTLVVCHDWETITHQHNGIIKTRHYTRGAPSHGDHAEVFELKLYTLVKEIPDLEEY